MGRNKLMRAPPQLHFTLKELCIALLLQLLIWQALAFALLFVCKMCLLAQPCWKLKVQAA